MNVPAGPGPGRSPRDDSFRSLSSDGGGGGATVFSCALCGCRFDHGGQVCGSCPMSNGCELVKCPNCGFQFPRTSWIADGFQRLWRRWRGKP